MTSAEFYVHFDRAQDAGRAGLLQVMAAHLDKALSINPGHLNALEQRAVIAQKAKESRTSHALWQRLLDAAEEEGDDDKRFEALKGLGVTSLDPADPNFGQDRKQIDRSLEYYRRALAVKPDDVDCLMSLGKFSGGLGDFGTASKCIEKAARLQPGRPGIQDDLAMVRRSVAKEQLRKRAAASGKGGAAGAAGGE